MAASIVFVLCVSALLVQSIAANPCGCGRWREWNTAEMAYAAPAYALAAPAYAPAPYSGPAYATKTGGAFNVAVASSITPTGISVLSENIIDGALEVAGSLPLLAGVAFEGAVPSAGAAGTAYSCGCGDVAISAESLAANAISAGYEAPRLYTRPGKLARPACGCY